MGKINVLSVMLVIFVIALYLLNSYYLKISVWKFTGIVLGILLFIMVFGNFAYKFSKRNSTDKEPNSFILPDKIAKGMKTVDMKTQYEASIIAMCFMLIGMVAFFIYYIFIAEGSTVMKFFAGFNIVCGLVLMVSFLITQYQQYNDYRMATEGFNDFEKTFKDSVSRQIMKGGNQNGRR